MAFMEIEGLTDNLHEVIIELLLAQIFFWCGCQIIESSQIVRLDDSLVKPQ